MHVDAFILFNSVFASWHFPAMSHYLPFHSLLRGMLPVFCFFLVLPVKILALAV